MNPFRWIDRLYRMIRISSAAAVVALWAVAVAGAGPTLAATWGPVLKSTAPAMVMLAVPNDQHEWVGFGSGSIVHRSGTILTNFHVIGDPETRQLRNQKGIVAVFVIKRPDEMAAPAYIAQFVRGDANLDLAILQIVTDLKGNPVNAAQLNLPVLRIGDSEELALGDELALLGFPGIGNVQSLTFTPGSVAGFLRESTSGVMVWIKTNAQIAAGNSGGAALDTNGNLIGVTSAEYINADPGDLAKIGLIRPINLLPGPWWPLLANGAAGVKPDSRTGPPSSQPANGNAGGGGNVGGGGNTGSTTGGSGNAGGATGGNTGNTGQGTGGSTGGNTGGGGQRKPPASAGVIIRGRIVDANTGRGIAGALFALIKPTWDPETELTDEDIQAYGQSDAQGSYRTEPPTPRGQTYYVVVYAKGYQPIVARLTIAGDWADEVELDVIRLQK